MHRNVFLGAALIVAVCSASGQREPEHDSLHETLQELQTQIRELQATVQELRDETAKYRAETAALRNQLAHSVGATSPAPPASEASPAARENPPAPADARLTELQEEIALLTGKVDEQYQTKVESGSKYRVRLSGIALFNLFSNSGVVDNVDNPTLALPPAPGESAGSFGGTLRQSILGLQVFGPSLAGAHTSASIQFDFGGGFPQVPNGVTFGLARLRTGWMKLQWQDTSITAGQDTLFFAPLAPTSFASLSTPALAYAGNLWAWVPQLRVEHKVSLSDTSSLNIAAGILDGITGEPPATEYSRPPQAGEQARQPAYAARLAWTHNAFGRPMTIGTAGYYDRENWGFDRNVDGWAGLADVNMPLGKWFGLSAEGYRGRAIGGLGGGIGTSVLSSGSLTDPTTSVLGLSAEGGWAQLKFAPTPKLEFNGAFGQDNPFARDVREFGEASEYTLVRNRGGLANVIFRPRSDLIMSLEYRRLRTFGLPNTSDIANQVNLGMGVLF